MSDDQKPFGWTLTEGVISHPLGAPITPKQFELIRRPNCAFCGAERDLIVKSANLVSGATKLHSAAQSAIIVITDLCQSRGFTNDAKEALAKLVEGVEMVEGAANEIHK